MESISNVSSDASNLERINRWSCAIARGRNAPSWDGDRTYNSSTLRSSGLSTEPSSPPNADRGNAHSEYLGPLATGVPGASIILALLVDLGPRIPGVPRPEGTRPLAFWWALSLYLGLLTYFIHGVLNNYLDTDKASAPFWGFLAMLVMLDLRRSGGQQSGIVRRVRRPPVDFPVHDDGRIQDFRKGRPLCFDQLLKAVFA